MSDALVQVSDVHKVYTRGAERVDVLKGLELEVGGGEFLALTVRSDFGTDYEHQGGVGRPTSISCRSPLPAASSKPSHDKHVASLSGESHYQTHPFCWHTNCMIN